jgi:membrane protease YdiL (CAAX protease family)
MTTAALSQPEIRKTGGLNVTLWIAQALLFVAFAAAGLMKVTMPIDQLAAKMPATPSALVRFIGLSELAGALGVLLPSLTRIRPRLTALAGVGLLVVMLLAAGTHIGRGELGALPVVGVLGGLAAFVAWGRGTRAVISPRS